MTDTARRVRRVLFLLLFVTVLSFAPQYTVKAQAATNMITVASKNKLTGGKFRTYEKGLRYLKADKTWAKDEWCMIDGNVYYFSPWGYAKHGWFFYNNLKYFANSNCVVYHKKLIKLAGKYMYLKPDGVLAVSKWIDFGTKRCRFDNKGYMRRSERFSLLGNYYYVKGNGARAESEFITIDGKTYYYGADGIGYSQKWVKTGGKYYFLKLNGTMAKNAWIGSFYVGSDGAKVTNAYVDGFWLDSSGRKADPPKTSSQYLFVGDSRTVGMSTACPYANTTYIAKVSMGYDWLVATAKAQIVAKLKKDPALNVIFAFGVNDLDNVSKYITFYKSMIKAWPNAHFYFMAVNPVKKSAENKWCTNARIVAFNTQLKAAFPKQFMNSYAYLLQIGFQKDTYKTQDGLHYLPATYQTLYRFVMNKIKVLSAA